MTGVAKKSSTGQFATSPKIIPETSPNGYRWCTSMSSVLRLKTGKNKIIERLQELAGYRNRNVSENLTIHPIAVEGTHTTEFITYSCTKITKHWSTLTRMTLTEGLQLDIVNYLDMIFYYCNLIQARNFKNSQTLLDIDFQAIDIRYRPES